MKIARLLAVLAASLLLHPPANAATSLQQVDGASTLHTRVVVVPAQPAASSTKLKGATALAGTVAGTSLDSGTTYMVPMIGRNVSLTISDNDAGGELALTVRFEGYDQFYQPISESITANSGSATTVGAKVFSRVTARVVTSIAGLEASDTYAVGIGDVVALPIKFSSDLSEIKQAYLVVAAQTTQTAKTINTTNFDTANFAVKAGFFASSAVVNGDAVVLLVRTTPITNDNVKQPAR